MHEKMTSQISFNLLLLKDEYLKNKMRYNETETILKLYSFHHFIIETTVSIMRDLSHPKVNLFPSVDIPR